MSDTEQINASYKRSAEYQYSNRLRVNEIKSKTLKGETISSEDIIWLCELAKDGINSEQSSWFDNG